MIGYRDDYTADCILFYPYFNEHFRVIAIDISKQEALDADLKSMQQIKVN